MSSENELPPHVSEVACHVGGYDFVCDRCGASAHGSLPECGPDEEAGCPAAVLRKGALDALAAHVCCPGPRGPGPVHRQTGSDGAKCTVYHNGTILRSYSDGVLRWTFYDKSVGWSYMCGSVYVTERTQDGRATLLDANGVPVKFGKNGLPVVDDESMKIFAEAVAAFRAHGFDCRKSRKV